VELKVKVVRSGTERAKPGLDWLVIGACNMTLEAKRLFLVPHRLHAEPTAMLPNLGEIHVVFMSTVRFT
jgi:hypothetical protein